MIDLSTRLVVGWAMDWHMQTSLVESALKNALSWRVPTNRLVHHSDRGGQYASSAYRRLLSRHGIGCSMSRKGDCWDKAVMESFFGTYNRSSRITQSGKASRTHAPRRWTTSRSSTTANASTLRSAIERRRKTTRPPHEFSTGF
ncbi:MAG: transposase family protein [Planctomycetes bacterium]|nr:transposase family protein [Planctomycetota bacterium]